MPYVLQDNRTRDSSQGHSDAESTRGVQHARGREKGRNEEIIKRTKECNIEFKEYSKGNSEIKLRYERGGGEKANRKLSGKRMNTNKGKTR